MHIFPLRSRLLIPVLPGNIRIFFLQYHRLRPHQASIIIIDSDTPQIAFIRLIDPLHPLLDIILLVGKIILLDHIIVDCVRDLPHTHQIIFHILSGLSHQLFHPQHDILPGRRRDPEV